MNFGGRLDRLWGGLRDLEDPTDLGGSVVDLGGSVSDSVFVSRTSAESQGTVTVTILLEMVVTMVVE